jgi:hypothetical protein
MAHPRLSKQENFLLYDLIRSAMVAEPRKKGYWKYAHGITAAKGDEAMGDMMKEKMPDKERHYLVDVKHIKAFRKEIGYRTLDENTKAKKPTLAARVKDLEDRVKALEDWSTDDSTPDPNVHVGDTEE